MFAVIDKITRECHAVVASTDGYDAALFDFVAVTATPAELLDLRWDVATEQFVPRPATAHEATEQALQVLPRFQALRTATPAEVEAWIDANVVDLASARRVLVLLVLGIQLALKTRQQ